MDLRALSGKVVHLAREAGEAIMDIYQREGDWEVEQKADHSPLTLADRRSNELICKGLEQLPGHYPIISEENKTIPYEERKSFEYCWMVDPLDGTKEFIKRNGEFTVNIALIHENRPILGVVHVPVTGATFWAAKGEGAHWTNGSHEEPIHAASFLPSAPHLKIIASRSHLNPETEAYVALYKEPTLVSRGSSLKFMLLAEGEAHVYPRLAPTMEWDTAAAQIILEEAGGSVLEADSQLPLTYNKPNLLNPFFIAYGKRP
ncbi:MAG: 3'(2'),5'-bisphosphate nucleotidase CysQ [Saprospirales bacterium]|nr:3'(2'),5'-bisphosphate nucleotidase CysQ [Saprospirales bacterium]MBK6902592.1 3'(2'),5'-bisphosphate nucleotidase CysQ [Saprospirales bacterium]